MNRKNLVLGIALCAILFSGFAVAQMTAKLDTSKLTVEKAPLLKVAGPDLTVSAQVTGAPLVGTQTVLVPLQITVKNEGTTAVTSDFNVGGWGKATDGNVYGFDYLVSGDTTHERAGVYVSGLAAGAELTFQGYLVMIPQPLGTVMSAGTKYEIRAMVDFNLDPDASMYQWGVSEIDESNNEQVINYPFIISTVLTTDFVLAKK